MIICGPAIIMRSDGLPSDRWRMIARNLATDIQMPMCDCPCGHASNYDAECCRDAEACLELMLAGDW